MSEEGVSAHPSAGIFFIFEHETAGSLATQQMYKFMSAIFVHGTS